MRILFKNLGILAICLAGLFSCNAQENAKAEIEISPGIMKKNLEYLASDDLMGRKTGTEGISKAADYITTIFKENGIEPYYKTYKDQY